MLEYLYGQEKAQTFEFGFPALKEIFQYITIKKLGDGALEADIDKEKKPLNKECAERFISR